MLEIVLGIDGADDGRVTSHSKWRDRRASARVGRIGERLTRWWLTLKGYRVLASNWHVAGGELDLVAIRLGTLLVVEVKTLSQPGRRRPMDAVNWTKRRRLVTAARAFVSRERPRFKRMEFAVAEVTLRPFPRIRVIRDAFRADEVRWQ